jgi:hypothetical protein
LSDLTKALAAPPNGSRYCCIIGQISAEHPDGPAIAAAVANPEWTGAALSRLLAAHAVKVSSSSINLHRKNHACLV